MEHIAKRFGPVVALRDINRHLHKGEALGLLGDNGSGKSTLIKIIAGFQKPDVGRMLVHGRKWSSARSTMPGTRHRVRLPRPGARRSAGRASKREGA